MQISIIHGSDKVAARKKLQQLADKYESLSVVRASGGEITVDFLVNNLRGGDLFVTQKLVVLENPDSEMDWGRLGNAEEVELVLYFDKELPVTSRFFKEEYFKKARIMGFEAPPDKSIFEWLDLVADKNPRVFEMLDRLQKEFGEQYLLTMLFYLLRRQVMPSSGGMKSKLERQRQSFPIERIEELYKTAIEYDYQTKRGLIEGRTALFLVVERFMSK